MPAVKTKKPSNKMAEYRKRLRSQGLRPVQIWVPDSRSPKFLAEARRQAKLVAASPGEAEDLAFIAALVDPDDLA